MLNPHAENISLKDSDIMFKLQYPTMTSQDRSQIESYTARVHMNSKVYYVTIPMDVVRKMGVKKDDLVMMKIAHGSPPEGF